MTLKSSKELKFLEILLFCAIAVYSGYFPCVAADVIASYGLPMDHPDFNDDAVAVLDAFVVCNFDDCAYVCGTKNLSMAYCDEMYPKLCMCTAENFYTSEIEGTISSVDKNDLNHKSCSVACGKRASYARIWSKFGDKSQRCVCLRNQQTSIGKITLCDENAINDLCKDICQTDSAVCAFNGVCLCRKNWEHFFTLQIPNIRKEVPEDMEECSQLCSSYHHDYVPRIFDTRMMQNASNSAPYAFREKYCLCGDWLDLGQNPKTQEIIKQGFQICTGLRCKRRCGMDEAVCEPKHKRACLCRRQHAIMEPQLWVRLPTHGETKCYEACTSQGLDARVIDWNPFLNRQEDPTLQHYRKSDFQYMYDGKFCHCVKIERDMHQYRPCTDEMCRVICGHNDAICDSRTRRACFCNTNQLTRGIGRKPDPGEMNCNIACRYGLFDAKIVDLKWETQVDSWGVRVSKYCACLHLVSAAGFTHCDPYHDDCPTYCDNPDAYCTREKYCYCGINPNMLENNPMVRLGNGKEQDECGEKCRSWMFPMTNDDDNKPFVFDEAMATCGELGTGNCPHVDTTPWTGVKAGSYSVPDPLELKLDATTTRKFCLCAKSQSVSITPGSRFSMHMEPGRVSKNLPCFLNRTCVIVGNGIHIV